MKDPYQRRDKYGQQVLSYISPFVDTAHLSANLFLKGRIMDKADGDPLRGVQLISGSPDMIPQTIAPGQVHGTKILHASTELCLPERPEGDGIFLDQRGISVSLRFADCFPVLLSSSVPEPWLMVLHSGYMGTTKNIVKKAIGKITAIYGRNILDSTLVWVGPGIGPCCYTRNIQDPSTRLGTDRLPPDCISVAGTGKISIDIGKAISTQLEENGILSGNIYMIRQCTSCNDSLYYSYRKNGTSCRMMLMARLTDPYQNSPFWWENI